MLFEQRLWAGLADGPVYRVDLPEAELAGCRPGWAGPPPSPTAVVVFLDPDPRRFVVPARLREGRDRSMA
jgi:hypothetical protein